MLILGYRRWWSLVILVAEQRVLEPMVDHVLASHHVDFVFDQSSFAQTCPLPNTNFPIVNHVSACVFWLFRWSRLWKLCLSEIIWCSEAGFQVPENLYQAEYCQEAGRALVNARKWNIMYRFGQTTLRVLKSLWRPFPMLWQVWRKSRACSSRLIQDTKMSWVQLRKRSRKTVGLQVKLKHFGVYGVTFGHFGGRHSRMQTQKGLKVSKLWWWNNTSKVLSPSKVLHTPPRTLVCGSMENFECGDPLQWELNQSLQQDLLEDDLRARSLQGDHLEDSLLSMKKVNVRKPWAKSH